jgi:lipoprotein-releasing system permease protein
LILFITKKFLEGRKNSSGFSIFSIIAILGIGIGVAALIIALSVLNGFEEVIQDKLVNLDSHIQIVGFSDKPLSNQVKTVEEVNKLIGNELTSINSFVAQLVIVGKKKIKEGITLKGIPNKYFSDKTGIRVISGGLNLEDKSNQIIIGKTLASKLLVSINDEIVIYALRGSSTLNNGLFPSIEKFKIVGIFESGMAKYDDTFAYIDLTTSQSFLELNDDVSGYEIKLSNISNVDSLVNLLQSNLRYPHYVKSVFQSYQHIFNWIELQKKPIPFVLGLIILVAVFNIISTLLMIILEKMNSIGILRSLGAKRRQITIIFLLHGIVIGTIGVFFGNVLAYTLSIIQIKFDIITLPGAIYFVSKVPLIINLYTYLLISGITFLLVLIVSIIPSLIASKISPLKILRFN